jgi:hypothetical protein
MKAVTLIVGALVAIATAAPQGPAPGAADKAVGVENGQAPPPAENVEAAVNGEVQNPEQAQVEEVDGEQDQNVEGEEEQNVDGEEEQNVDGEEEQNVDIEQEENFNGEEVKNIGDKQGDDQFAPQVVKNVDGGAFNNFAFANKDLQYLNAFNDFELQAFVDLAIFNGLNIDVFQAVFVQDVFNINAVIQIQQIALLSHLGSLGVFNNFDLSLLQLNVVELGALGGIGGFDINSIVNPGVVTQVQNFVQTKQLQAVVFN